MKNIFLITTFLVVFFSSAFAQSTTNKGYISYNVAVDSDQPAAMFFAMGTSLELAFKGEKTKVIAKVGTNTVKITADNSISKAISLMDVLNDKKAVKMTEKDFAEAKKGLADLKSNPKKFTEETKTIAGYTCKKVLMKDTKSGTNIIIYVTNKIKPEGEMAQELFNQFKGFPLGIMARNQGTTVRITAKKVSTAAPSDSVFSMAVPEGYKLTTVKELENTVKQGGQ